MSTHCVTRISYYIMHGCRTLLPFQPIRSACYAKNKRQDISHNKKNISPKRQTKSQNCKSRIKLHERSIKVLLLKSNQVRVISTTMSVYSFVSNYTFNDLCDSLILPINTPYLFNCHLHSVPISSETLNGTP